jgi:epsilon-lactone hydrolase
MTDSPSPAPEAQTGLPRRLFAAAPIAAAAAASTVPAAPGALAQASTAGMTPRALPARTLPVPRTVSPELQARIAAPYPAGWDEVPQTPAAWKDLAARSAADVARFVQDIRDQFRLRVDRVVIGGVPAFAIAPPEVDEANRGRLLVHLHGGGYVLFPGEAGAGEGMLMAGHGRIRVVSVDYRMAPDFPYPAALDDAAAVWRALLRDHDPRRMAVFGSSAGGGLTLALVLRARRDGLPGPAAIAPGTPWVDLTGEGDSLEANAYVNNVLVANSGWAGAAAALYAAGHDLRDPLVSPIFGDFHGLPPAILTSGTRDLFLSHAVRAHRKLRQAGVEAVLQVFEGQSHAQYLDHGVPETAEALGEIARFLTGHMAA